MISLFRNLYLLLLSLTQNHILALLMLSAFTSLLMFILNWLFRVLPRREAELQKILTPQTREIREKYSGMQAQAELRKLYRRYRYHPILALRSALPLFFQLPFLFAAYHALNGLEELSGVSFWIINDLSQADAMVLGYNVLPFLMTGINLLTALLSPTFRLKDKVQAFLIAVFFLALLYKAPAALLIYWTTNNLFFLFRVLGQRILAKDHQADAVDTSTELKRVLPDIQIKLLLPFFLLIILMNVLEFLADGEGMYVYRFSKTVPLLVAGVASYYLMVMNGDFPHHKLMLGLAGLPFLVVLIAHVCGWYLIPTNRYVIIAWLAAFYLVFSALLLICQRIKVRAVRIDRSSSSWREFLLTALLLLTPALHLAAANQDYLSGWFYLLFMLLPFVIFALARLILIPGDAFDTQSIREKGLNRNYALAFAMLFCYLPVFRAMLQKNSAHDGDFWVILFVAMLVIQLLSRLYIQRDHVPTEIETGSPLRATLYTIFVALFLTSLINFTLSLHRGESRSKRNLQHLPQDLQGLELKDKPNIYLFVYDGMPNPRVFREQNLPLEPLQVLFDHYGYKIYEDTYTLGNESLNSMAMTLNISAEQYQSMSKMQDIYSGNSVVNLLLTGAGYGSYNLLENYFTGTYAITNQDLVTEYFPPKELTAVESDFFLTLLRGVLQGEFRFDTKGIMVADRYTEADRQQRKHELIKDGISPKFVIDQVSKPSHSQNSGKCLPNETELWIERYYQALEFLERDLKALSEHDPNSIAVFIGDHGPSLLGDCYVLQNYKREDITPELMWDRIGTMVAIHWPDSLRASKYDRDLTLNQDLFAVILAYLADDPAPLRLMPDRTFSGYGLLTRPAVKFNKGRVY
ncbi:MAG: YidC/Oxa1 family membrane protein insertase [Candidatus Cloacimonetes bacterium]|nr:YidC/Oxa1 family membrane protein insertase [Candidatus Cloacimonadota bacterium]